MSSWLSLDIGVFALKARRNVHRRIAAITPELPVCSIKQRGKLSGIACYLLALAVAVEVPRRSVIGFAVGIEIHRTARRRPLVAHLGALHYFQFYLAPFNRLEVDGHRIAFNRGG